MDLEDQYRFEIEAEPEFAGNARILLDCDRCHWGTEITDRITLAELNQRADEHTEVCR